MKIRNILLAGMAVCGELLLLASCQEEGLVVNTNGLSYIGFSRKMTTDTTKVCFQFYGLEEGQDVKVAEIPIEVSICGKIQDKDLEFTVSVDEALSTFPKSQCILPEVCKIKNGQLKDTIYIKLKNSENLKTETKLIAIKVNEAGEVKEGDFIYSRALIAVTDRLFKPDWWALLDIYDGTYSSVDQYYLGYYSETKFIMFLAELQKDDVVFDGKDKQVLRKYSLRLKNTLKRENAERAARGEEPLKDENGVTITVAVAG